MKEGVLGKFVEIPVANLREGVSAMLDRGMEHWSRHTQKIVLGVVIVVPLAIAAGVAPAIIFDNLDLSQLNLTDKWDIFGYLGKWLR